MSTYVSYELLNTNRNGMRLLIEVLTSQYHVRALRTQKELETFEFLYLGAPTRYHVDPLMILNISR